MQPRTAVEAIRAGRVIGIVRAGDAVDAERAARTLLTAGLPAVEISLTTPDALEVVDVLARDAPPGAFVGVGTVLDERAAQAAVAAGAAFLVAPMFDPAVIECGHHHGIAVIPGASSPTEMVAARAAGADLIKIFPASAWTPRVVRDVLQALPDLDLVPTGGVDLGSAADWIRSGAVAVGLGSAVTAAASEPGRIGQLLTELAAAGEGSA